MSNTSVQEEHIVWLAEKVTAHLHNKPIYHQLEMAAQNEVTKGNVKMADLKKGIIAALNQSGWERKLRNAVYQTMQKYSKKGHPLESPEQRKEPIIYIRKAQVNWEKRILKSLNSMCTELSVPLARKRPDKEQKEMQAKWTELSTEEPDLSSFRPVYAPKDFLEVLASLNNPNMVDSNDHSFQGFWGIIQVSLKVKDIHQLRLQFSELSIKQSQTGVDDGQLIMDLFELDRVKMAKKVVVAGHGPLAQEFGKKGCPVSYRAQLWCQMLGIELDDVDILYYEQLKACVFQHDLLVDSLIYKDVKLTATNDDQYFVFEDYLYQVLLPFSRDTVVLEHFSESSASPAKSYICGRLGVDEYAVTYPPSGVIPFHGFAMYVAPLCYVYNDPVLLYFVFREFYVRHLYRLHTVSSHPQGILSLCLLFENLLQSQEPKLFYHLKSFGIQPLKVAFKWLVRAFSGYLASDQVLLLWDRILAYNSLEILPVLAMAIFSFRKTNLLQVQSFNAAEAVLADITTLKVIPLVQLSLFSQS